MLSDSLAVNVACFGIALWLGLYLLARQIGNVRLTGAGLVLIAYSTTWAVWTLDLLTPARLVSDSLSGWRWWILFLPAPFVAVTLLAFGRISTDLRQGIAKRILIGAPLVISLGFIVLSWPAIGITPTAALLVIGVAIVGFALAALSLDAAERGEAVLTDLLRSFDGSLVVGGLVGGEVVVAMTLGGGVSSTMLALLLAEIATALVLVAFGDTIQTLVDDAAFPHLTSLRRDRAELRSTATALPRARPAGRLADLNDDEFFRLTRRTLGQFGDLPRLATSPLVHLREVDRRLVTRGGADDPINRARELKAILAESVLRLKPLGDCSFGTTDEWRHYNSLYFPYVAGIKPYGRRIMDAYLDSTTRQVLTWFRDSVPERTLYNWQTSAAKLIARDLRARESAEDGTQGH